MRFELTQILEARPGEERRKGAGGSGTAGHSHSGRHCAGFQWAQRGQQCRRRLAFVRDIGASGLDSHKCNESLVSIAVQSISIDMKCNIGSFI